MALQSQFAGSRKFVGLLYLLRENPDRLLNNDIVGDREEPPVGAIDVHLGKASERIKDSTAWVRPAWYVHDENGGNAE